jgi:hypothetical protein
MQESMIASAHVVGGVVAGLTAALGTTNRELRIAAALGLGVLSHIVLDAIPHADYGKLQLSTVRVIVLCEFAAVGWFSWLMLRRRHTAGRPLLAAGLAGAVIPDAKFLAAMLLPGPAASWVETTGDQFHGLFHAGPASLAAGMMTQVSFTLLLLASLRFFAGGTRWTPRATIEKRMAQDQNL